MMGYMTKFQPLIKFGMKVYPFYQKYKMMLLAALAVVLAYYIL